MANPNLGGKNLGGGAFNGISPKQTISSHMNSEVVSTRKILRDSWNRQYAGGVVNNKQRVITPFRAVYNMGDFLGRKNYSCGGPNPSAPLNVPRSRGNMGAIWSVCNNTGIPASSCNPKFVADSSDYTRFRKERSFNLNYNDKGYGGYTNSSYEALMRVRHHH